MVITTCANQDCDAFDKAHEYEDDYLENVGPRCGSCGEPLQVKPAEKAEAA